MLKCFPSSTPGLATGGVGWHGAAEVVLYLGGMVPGRDSVRYSMLYAVLDTGGSDVRLSTGAAVEGGRQLAPYPAIACDTRPRQSYRLQASQHINVLGLVTFLSPKLWKSVEQPTLCSCSQVFPCLRFACMFLRTRRTPIEQFNDELAAKAYIV